MGGSKCKVKVKGHGQRASSLEINQNERSW